MAAVSAPQRLRSAHAPASSYARSAAIFLALGALWACEDLQPLNQLTPAGAFDPNALDFGEVAVGSSSRLTADLANTGPIALTITEVSRVDSFTMSGDGKSKLTEVTIAPGDIKIVDVEFLAMAEGEVKGEFVVKAEGLEIKLPVRGVGVIRRTPKIVVEPTALDFGGVELNGMGRKDIVLRNDGNGPGTINGARLASTGADISAMDTYRLEGLTFPLTLAEGESAMASVSFFPTTAGQKRDQLTFLGAVPQADVVLDLDGSGLETRGGLVCTPAALDYGRVERGMTRSQTVNCEARGGGVRYLGATVDNGPSASLFAVTLPPPASDLMAGEVVRFFVEFRPDGLPQRHTGSVSVQYSGAMGTQSVRIPLTGEVIPPPVTNTAISVVLRWDTNLTDLDTHLVRPGGRFFDNTSDCYFANSSPDWGTPGDSTDNPFLDVDDTDGRGPENINLSRTAAGNYQVQIHYWNGFIPSRATVEVFLDGMSVGTFNQTLRCGDLWSVGTVQWNGMTGTFVPSTSVTRSGEGPCG